MVEKLFFIFFLVGGAFGVVHKSGAIEAGIRRLMTQLGQFKVLMIPLTMLMFSILGFSIGLAEETIIFVPIGIIIARTLGYDALTGAAIVILGAASGFIGGMLNPFTVGVAQSVAELPLFSGWGLRSIIYIFILLAAMVVVMRYARRVKRSPEQSIVYKLEQEEVDRHQQEAVPSFSRRQFVSLLFIVGAIGLNILGFLNSVGHLMK